MNRGLLLATIAVVPFACSKASGPTGEPIDRMFETRYEKFISSAGAHTAMCETAISAKGDGGTKNDAIETSVEVDADGNFRLQLEGGLVVVRVGSVAWQREKDGKFERIESGARTDILRDDAIAGWRDVLAEMRDRMTLTRAETTTIGERQVDVYTISTEPGGGNDGGVQVVSGEGAVGLDAQTGFPVKLTYEGSWEGPATPPAEGRVTWTVEKLECTVEIPEEALEAITPAIATPTPAAAATATADPAASPANTKGKPTPTPVPTTSRDLKVKLKIK